MNGAIAHRGPDGDGFFNAPRASLAHRRLAIIDRAGGHQPMANEDGSCWITFNGEVYNHKSLRPLLEAKGHRFRTASDTEVILHAWEEFGTACVDRLEGMFAFAIFDGRRQELFAARDRLGQEAVLLHDARRHALLRERAAGAEPRRRVEGRDRSRLRSRVISRSGTFSRRPHLPRCLQADARALDARGQRAGDAPAGPGTSPSSTRTTGRPRSS